MINDLYALKKVYATKQKLEALDWSEELLS
jgi:hypothetical protein